MYEKHEYLGIRYLLNIDPYTKQVILVIIYYDFVNETIREKYDLLKFGRKIPKYKFIYNPDDDECPYFLIPDAIAFTEEVITEIKQSEYDVGSTNYNQSQETLNRLQN
jgi:hypothetical protein